MPQATKKLKLGSSQKCLAFSFHFDALHCGIKKDYSLVSRLSTWITLESRAASGNEAKKAVYILSWPFWYGLSRSQTPLSHEAKSLVSGLDFLTSQWLHHLNVVLLSIVEIGAASDWDRGSTSACFWTQQLRGFFKHAPSGNWLAYNACVT